ncbi:hypothetical protein BC936DRAFT_137735 [Jimgerdemannia flammicorona]|uniref:DNA mismatch repair protein MutS core domain-containing protein n=1 Tax=Jimgerdemannia flammicorona TaxID=994334 RepID=A0A433DMU8_9FUNG|nr:hypothetical protein BC936DRAFT_137735 [Jimgerdemannia flammicorona]
MTQVLVSVTAVEPQKTKLCKIIEENFPSACLTPIGRKYFNDAIGLNYIKQYGLEEDSAALILGLTSKYVEGVQNIIFTNHSVKFKYQGVEDCVTARNLELIANITNPKSSHSLYARLLRTNILQPLTGRSRHASFLLHKHNFGQLAMKSFQDIDHLISALIKIPRRPSVQQSEHNINHAIMLKHTLKSIKPLVAALGSCQNALLVAVRWFEERIHEVINEDATYQKSALGLRNQRCYAAGVNGLLDVARQTYKETIDDIYELVGQYIESTGIQIKLQFNPASGFHLTTSTDQLNDQSELPLIFINVVRKRKTLTFTTLELVRKKKFHDTETSLEKVDFDHTSFDHTSMIQKNNKINESLTEVYLMSDKTIAELINDVRSAIGILYKTSESIAMLDMLTSFAHMCTIANYTRPEFTDTLAIRSGRHPMHERIYLENFVPNDTYASETANFQFITGPNMSGKSTYLRQIALFGVMAQIACQRNMLRLELSARFDLFLDVHRVDELFPISV